MADFAHLHLHTLYSLLQGAIRLGPLMERVKAGGMDSVAMTDTANLYGAVDFVKQAKKHGVHPILGSEIFVQGADARPAALVLLAENGTGYRNLRHLLSTAWLEHHEPSARFPLIPFSLLSKHTEGLFALSGGLDGEPARAFVERGPDAAREAVARYRQLFAPAHYHLELQINGYPERRRVNEFFKELSRDEKIPLVATGDCHYLDRRDARAHEVLLSIAEQVRVEELRRSRQVGETQYLRTAEEMLELFEDVPDAVYRTAEIAEACSVDLELGKHTYLPNFEVGEGHDQASWLAKVSAEGLGKRFAEIGDSYPYDEQEYLDRLELELKVITDMGFPGYFLIVQEFINWAKDHGVAVGPGRGSGAGSLVAWVLRITDLDPIHHGLLFERFLNPERVSMPDFDVDFCQTRRDEVIEHVNQLYGVENVGQIITFGQLKARSVIRDVVRVMGLPFAEGDRLAKLVPPDLGMTLEKALQQEPRLKELYESREQPIYREIIDIAMKLEGLNRQAGVHAAGVVIGDKPLWEYVPVIRSKDGDIVTQFAKEEVEEAGLVKFDFLGLKTLTMIEDALRLVNRGRPEEEKVRVEGLPLDDPKVYELISRGDTTGVFQLESSGFKELLKKLRPDRFSDIVAAVALYRPGPLGSGMVDDFIARKHGRQAVSYPHPALERVLEETKGVIVYQEQVMEISRILAGYSLGRADLLRRAMGKKKAEVMAAERSGFLEGAAANEIDPDLAGQIFDLMEKFAAYGFNKSHSAAYGLITYQTAWLKTHYPVEAMAALLTSERDNTDKVVTHIGEVRRDMGIEVVPPDINRSGEFFDVLPPDEGERLGKILFGLGAVKGVGHAAIEAILEAREEEVHFRGLLHFCEAVDTRRVNKRTVEALIKAGCFDYVGVPRENLLATLDRAMERGQKAQKDREMGQSDLFGGGFASGGKSASATENERADIYRENEEGPWTERERLGAEKEALGFYLTGHPLDRFAKAAGRLATPLTQLARCEPYEEVKVAVIVEGVQERVTKAGARMARLVLEDLAGRSDAVCFSGTFLEIEELLKGDDPLLLSGRVRVEGEGEEATVEFRVQGAQRLEDVRAEVASAITLSVPPEVLDEGKARRLRELLAAHPGRCTTFLKIREEGSWETVLRLGELSVQPTEALLAGVDALFGRRVTEVH
ncbi:MAG: DNA polymerase III subunit alpha [Deltaproteobacteria bacterium]|nr:DNA polymerase III subunit alpha [Deltaproteobacteria bacterium]